MTVGLALKPLKNYVTKLVLKETRLHIAFHRTLSSSRNNLVIKLVHNTPLQSI